MPLRTAKEHTKTPKRRKKREYYLWPSQVSSVKILDNAKLVFNIDLYTYLQLELDDYHIFIGKGCPRLESPSSLLVPVVSDESSFVQMVSDMFNAQTVTWNTVTILYDSTEMTDKKLIKEMMMLVQKKISIVMFDISMKSAEELFSLKSSLGKNFFVIGKRNMALDIFDIVRKNNSLINRQVIE